MSQAKLTLLTLRPFAVLVACSFLSVAQADEGDETLGVQSSVFLPVQANGKPPTWTGKAFRQGVVALVDLVVQDFQSNVRDTNIVNIGEDKSNFGCDFVPVFADAVELAADIPAGFLHP